MNENEILTILADWNFWGNFKIELLPRPIYLTTIKSLVSPLRVSVIDGVRRSGKSSLVLLYLQEVLIQADSNSYKKNALYINFEDPRFPPLNSVDLMHIYEVYLTALRPDPDHLVILDEIQNVEGWEKFVRFLSENKRVRTIVTGSSSKLLSLEYATVLAGRHLNIEVFPLSFQEFIEFKGLKISDTVDLYSNRIEIKGYLKEYLEFGGFPEVVLESDIVLKKELLRKYLETIALKDVVKRFSIKEIEKLENLTRIYLTNVSTLQSYNKVKNAVNLSLDSSERYSKYLMIARLIFMVPKFDFSVKKQLYAPRKVYSIDTGLACQYGFQFMEKIGNYMENMVAIELIRRYGEDQIFYWKDKQQREVDFIIVEKEQIFQIIQVSYDLTHLLTKKRELRGLFYASEELSCENLLIITWNDEKEENFNEKSIKIVPLWKWLLIGVNSSAANPFS